MPLHEQAPRRFKSSIVGMLKQFGKQSDSLGKIFSDSSDVEEIVDKFIKSNPTIGKVIETMRLSAKGRTFTLTPLVAEYNKESEDINVHQMYHLLHAEKSVDHVFVQPIDACEGVYYHYELYIPIPRDMRADTPEKLLGDHWEMVHKNTPIEFKELDFQFEPRYTIGRVYGWDGSWMAYSAIIKDTGALWSTPLTEAPYRGTDPFLIIPKR